MTIYFVSCITDSGELTCLNHLYMCLVFEFISHSVNNIIAFHCYLDEMFVYNTFV